MATLPRTSVENKRGRRRTRGEVGVETEETEEEDLTPGDDNKMERARERQFETQQSVYITG